MSKYFELIRNNSAVVDDTYRNLRVASIKTGADANIYSNLNFNNYIYAISSPNSIIVAHSSWGEEKILILVF